METMETLGLAGGTVEHATTPAALTTTTHLKKCNVSNWAIATARSERLQSLHNFECGRALVHAVKMQTGHTAIAQLVAQVSRDV